MGKNILYLSYDGMTDPLGQSQVLPYIIGLTKEGYQFVLISCEKEERYQQHKTIIENICRENNINWQPITYTKSPPVLSTLYDIYKLNRLAKKLHKVHRFSLIHCRSYITALIGLAFKQKHQTKFLFDMRGFWADERIDGKIWNKTKFPYKKIYSFFKRKEIDFINHSDGIVSLTNEGKREILSWEKSTIEKGKISVIPTCADLKLFDYNLIDKKDTLAIKKELGLSENNFILTYLGSLGTWYMVEEMVDFFATLKITYPAAKFIIYTADDFNIVKKYVKQQNLNRDDFIFKTLQRIDVPKYLSISDLSISFIKPLYSKKASSPTKMGEILGMGIPMVCNNNVGDVEEIITTHNCGIIVDSFNASTYEKAIKQFTKSPFTKAKLKDASATVFSLKKGITNFTKVYDNILNE